MENKDLLDRFCLFFFFATFQLACYTVEQSFIKSSGSFWLSYNLSSYFISTYLFSMISYKIIIQTIPSNEY